jgi:hypothetical protein
MAMRASKLVIEFDTQEVVPVDVNDVVSFLQTEGIKDEINFVGVDIDSQILRGNIIHFVIPRGAYKDPVFCADIYYDINQTRDWQRLVCCKELIHLLDAERERVKTGEQITHQIQRMVLPTEFQEIATDGVRVFTDKVAIYFAVATLFPMAARELLRPAFEQGAITAEDIARLADIPERYALLVMSEQWPKIHSILVGNGD